MGSSSDNPLSFLDHIGFDIALISSAHQLPDALLGFYRDRTGDYDVARLERDMDTWAPMVTALEAAAAAKKGTLA